MAIEASNYYSDYSPEKINSELKQGRSREELAGEYGHKNYKALDMYMRRNGYKWDKDKQYYIPREAPNYDPEEHTPNKKTLKRALEMFEEGKEPKEVAEVLGFESHMDLAGYMRRHNYFWNSKTQKYEHKPENGDGNGSAKVKESKTEYDTNDKTNTSHLTDDEAMNLLLENREILIEMLDRAEGKTLPRYSLAGVRVPKTVNLANKLHELIKDFTEEKNISQREFFEIAVIETLRRYGYDAEIRGLLN